MMLSHFGEESIYHCIYLLLIQNTLSMISAKELLAHVGHTAQSRTALIDPFPHWLLFDSLPSKKKIRF